MSFTGDNPRRDIPGTCDRLRFILYEIMKAGSEVPRLPDFIGQVEDIRLLANTQLEKAGFVLDSLWHRLSGTDDRAGSTILNSARYERLFLEPEWGNDPSYAYHEAGHIVVAAVQSLTLFKAGIHLAPDGRGVCYYRCRKPRAYRGDDLFGRQSVTSLFAGLEAQLQFNSACTSLSASADHDHVERLLVDMYRPLTVAGKPEFEAADRKVAQEREALSARSKELVSIHGEVIRAVAEALWAQPSRLQDPQEHEERWSDSAFEKRLDGPTVVQILRKHGINASSAGGTP